MVEIDFEKKEVRPDKINSNPASQYSIIKILNNLSPELLNISDPLLSAEELIVSTFDKITCPINYTCRFKK